LVAEIVTALSVSSSKTDEINLAPSRCCT